MFPIDGDARMCIVILMVIGYIAYIVVSMVECKERKKSELEQKDLSMLKTRHDLVLPDDWLKD